jgi:hypothetical protein
MSVAAVVERRGEPVKVDLHVHSKASERPSEWILQKLGCPESFTEPDELYRIAKRRGMSLVTITDHNTNSGCLEIAPLPERWREDHGAGCTPGTVRSSGPRVIPWSACAFRDAQSRLCGYPLTLFLRFP